MKLLCRKHCEGMLIIDISIKEKHLLLIADKKNGNRGQLAKDRYNRQELTHVYFQFVQSKYKKTTIESVSRIPLLQRSLVMEPSVAPAGRFRVVVLLVGRSLITCLQVGGTLPTLQ